MQARRALCKSEYPGRVAHSYRSNVIFRKPLASHFGNDVLENVAVAVPAIANKPVLGGDVLTNDNPVGVAGVGDALYEVQPLGVAGQVDFGESVNGGAIMYLMGGSIAGRRCRSSAIMSA